MALAICASFVGMAHAKLEAASQSPSVLIVSLVRGSGNSVILSTNTLGATLEDAIGTSGTDSQLIGIVEFNITKSAPLAAKISQLVQAPSTAPEANHFVAFGADTTTWTALEVFSNITPAGGAPRTSTILTVTAGAIYSADILAAGAVYAGKIGILSFYAVDDENNTTTAGEYTGIFTVGFSA